VSEKTSDAFLMGFFDNNKQSKIERFNRRDAEDAEEIFNPIYLLSVFSASLRFDYFFPRIFYTLFKGLFLIMAKGCDNIF